MLSVFVSNSINDSKQKRSKIDNLSFSWEQIGEQSKRDGHVSI